MTEARELIISGGDVEVNVAGSWINVERIDLDRDDFIVKAYPNDRALWFPWAQLKAVREARH